MTSAAYFLAVPAQAADLGGDCCADLEERVAELEATTARKGNRKVSLTVSGWVNEAVFFWDDGVEKNAYVGTNELEQSRFRFVGEAKISEGWSAGYVIEIGLNGAGSKSFSQVSAGTTTVTDRKSAWFIKSKELGKVTVGKFDTATYHLIDNVDTTLTRSVSDFEAAGVFINGFRVRQNGAFIGSNITWAQIMGGFQNNSPGQSALRNVVRYDTPTFAGFTGSASWGEDDLWDVALNYRGEIGDFKLAGSIGYGESTDSNTGGQCGAADPAGDCQWWGAGALVQHVPTGLFVYGGYGATQIDLIGPGDDESTTWYVQAGIERKWLPLGKTNIFGEYRNDEVGLTTRVAGADLDIWGVGIVQNIEAADMSLYTVYHHYSGDITANGNGGVTGSIDDFDMLITGAKINF